MCGRFFFKITESELVRLFEAEIGPALRTSPALRDRYNIAPTMDLVACRRSPSAGRELVPLRWGLIPAWAKDDAFGAKTVNARSETAHEKPAYRESFRSMRCLIPASGFYEWRPGPAKRGVPKQPYAVRVRSGPMVFAGLWSAWRDPRLGTDAPELETCSILTRPAAGPIAEIHHRMPVILDEGRWGNWLDPGAVDVAGPRALLDSAPAPDDLELTAVSTRVNAVRNDDPELLTPVDDAGAGPQDPGEPLLFD